MPRGELAAALGGLAAPSAAALESSLRGALDRPTARSRYAQTLSLVEHLVAARGEGALVCVVARLGAGETIEDALRAETGFGEEELFESWRRWAEK